MYDSICTTEDLKNNALISRMISTNALSIPFPPNIMFWWGTSDVKMYSHNILGYPLGEYSGTLREKSGYYAMCVK